MPDYLQDIIDRSQAYQDPTTYPVDNNVPPPWEDPNAKKKKNQQLPMFPGGTGAPDGSTPTGPDQPPGMVFIPGRGYVPRGLQPPQQPPGPAWGQGAGILAPEIGGLPNSLPVYPGGVPLPQARPAAAPSREVDGSQSAGRGTENAPTETRSTAQVSGVDELQHGPGRDKFMQAPVDQAGQQAGMLGPLGGISDWLGKHSNTLLAMGAGLMGAPNLWQGLGRGFAFAGPASQQDIKMQMLLSTQQGAYNALRTAGVPDDLARLGATDKDVMKQLMDQYIVGQKYELKSIDRTDSWGQKSQQLVAVDPRDPTNVIDVQSGQRIGAGAAGGATKVGTMVQGPNGPTLVPHPTSAAAEATQGGQPASRFYAPGYNDYNVDQTKTGDEYLAQFSPEVQAEVKNRMKGAPPSLGRGGAQISQHIGAITQKYAEDMGVPMDAGTQAQRMVWARTLGDDRSGVGLQAKGFEQGMTHLNALSDNLVKQNLSGGMGIEPVAHGINAAFSQYGPQAELIREAQSLGTGIAGEVGKLNSGQSGGGVHERQSAAGLLSNPYNSRYDAAGALRGTMKLMEGGLQALEARRTQLFGTDPKNWPKGSEFVTDQTRKEIANIQKNIAKLEGTKTFKPDAEIDRLRVEPGEAPAAAASAAAPAATTPTKPGGRYVYDPKTNQMVLQ